jgi:A/G-specific adenine glycosylase
VTDFADALLDWYDRNARRLPWRAPPGGPRADPYRVWLSEIMLQQTTVKAVAPFFAKFLALFPDVKALAAAPDEAVMAAWAGLGYYSRARNLKRCAETVAGDHGGVFPAAKAGLLALPGIGDYTASAIAAIAHDERVAVVDGNVERVVTRQLALETPLPQAKPAIRDWLQPHVEELGDGRSGDFAQAMMDLGATICTPRSPACAICPVARGCAARGRNPERFPVKAAKAAKPARRGAAYVAFSPEGAVWLVRRPAKGLLGGMAALPTTDWSSRRDGATGPQAAPFFAAWRKAGTVSHVFTHFTLSLDVHCATVSHPDGDGWWSPAGAAAGLPSLMQKVLDCALDFRIRSERP